jgi:hypothetical protein
MKDGDLLHDVLRSSGQHALHVDAGEEVMRLSRDPLLLSQYLQRREFQENTPQDVAAVGDRMGHLQQVPALAGEASPPRPSAAEAFVQLIKEPRVETSFRPETFAATSDDRDLAIEPDGTSSTAHDHESLDHANFIGEVLILCGFVLAGASFLDFLVF